VTPFALHSRFLIQPNPNLSPHIDFSHLFYHFLCLLLHRACTLALLFPGFSPGSSYKFSLSTLTSLRPFCLSSNSRLHDNLSPSTTLFQIPNFSIPLAASGDHFLPPGAFHSLSPRTQSSVLVQFCLNPPHSWSKLWTDETLRAQR